MRMNSFSLCFTRSNHATAASISSHQFIFAFSREDSVSFLVFRYVLESKANSGTCG